MALLDELLAELLSEVGHELPAAVELRHELHADARVSGREADTAKRVLGALELPAVPVADTGFLIRSGPSGGPAVALRAELDALPVVEQTAAPWASVNGAMHACGHDVHMAALVAITRAARRIALPGALVSLFQPREEAYPSGARDIVEGGELKRQHVRAVVAVHVQPAVAPGCISVGSGPVNAAADEFEVVIHGRGGHGAYPHRAVNPVPILAQLVTAMDQLVGHVIDPTHPAVLTIASVSAGDSANVIPETAQLRGMARTTTESDRVTLLAEIRNTAHRLAHAYGAHAEVVVKSGEPVLVNDPGLARHTERLLAGSGLTLRPEAFRSCGSDDFAFYSAVCPILMMFLGVRTERVDGPEPALHHPRFLPADETVGQVAAAMCAGFVGALAAG
jgi:amidohydrolase